MADLDLEAGRAGDVEAEHAVVVVAAEAVRDRQVGGPRPVERGADVVAVVGLEHHVVQRLRQLERRPGERERVVPFVAVVEADLEHDAAAELHLEPVGLLQARARR